MILIIIILILVIIIYYYYNRINHYNVVLVKSDINSKTYLVRDFEDKQYTANLLGKIEINMNKLDEYLYENKNNYPSQIKYIEQLHEKLKNTIIQENSDNGIYTSYSINKGEQIIFCLRSRSKDNLHKIHDLNLIMYVVLHEMAHVACPEFGHTELFKSIFTFLTLEAIKLGIYDKIDFKNDNKEYCGLTISDSIV